MFQGGKKKARKERIGMWIWQKELLIPMYSTYPSEDMALIQVPNYSNVIQSTSRGVSVSSQD